MRTVKRMRELPENAVYDEIASPVGQLILIASSAGLHAILWDSDCHTHEGKRLLQPLHPSSDQPIIVRTQQQLDEYFHGQRTAFDLPLVLKGTDFQIQVWQQLLKIPYGKTISYGEQAEKMGDKNKARAVGMANGLNPISIVVPCHRVIGSNGQLVGFGGGIEKKAYLLQLEKNTQASS